MLRPGQAAFNLLNATWPHVAGRIRGTDDDPYYDDTRLDAFARRVAELLADTAAGRAVPMARPGRPARSEP
jgi:hypothetical protein